MPISLQSEGNVVIMFETTDKYHIMKTTNKWHQIIKYHLLGNHQVSCLKPWHYTDLLFSYEAIDSLMVKYHSSSKCMKITHTSCTITLQV